MQNTQECLGVPRRQQFPRSEVRVAGNIAFASTNTQCAYFSSVNKNIGSDITYIASTVYGDSFLINTPGVYAISLLMPVNSGASAGVYISANSPTLAGSIGGVISKYVLAYATIENTSAVAGEGPCTAVTVLNAGDVVRAQYDTVSGAFVSTPAYFNICKVSS